IALGSLPWRERKVIGLYYYGEVTMKEIGAEIGVNESRVSQLHARALRRLRESLGEMGPTVVAEVRRALVAFAAKKPAGAHATARASLVEQPKAAPPAAVVLPYDQPRKRLPSPSGTALKVRRPRQPVAVAR